MPLYGSSQNDLGTNTTDTVESADQNIYQPGSKYQQLEVQKISFKDIYPQIIASCITLSFVLQAGISMCFSAILLPQLMDPQSAFTVTPEEATWIASLMAIGTPFGSFICGPLMDYFGRKTFSLMCCFPNIIAWLLIVFTSNSVWTLYIGRLLVGLSGGMSTVTGVYVAEITHQQIRPMLLSLNSVFVSFGIFLTTVLGSYLHWRTVSVCCACCTIATFLLTAFIVPESPVWLIKLNNNNYRHKEEAKRSLAWLNPNKEIFEREWNKLIVTRQNTDNILQNQPSPQALNKETRCCSKISNIVSAYSKSSTLKPLLILIIIFLLQQLSGAYPIIFYAVQLFQSVESNFNEYTALVVLGALRFAMSIVSLILSGIFGRRTLMIGSSLGMALSSLTVAFIYSQKNIKFNFINEENTTQFVDENIRNLSALNSTASLPEEALSSLFIPSWVGVFCIIVFVGVSTIGVLTIPWTLTSELLPTSVRGTGCGILVSFAYVLLFITVKCFPFLLLNLKVTGLFYVFSAVSFITILFVYFFMPETLGKSLEEIERYFSKPKPQTLIVK